MRADVKDRRVSLTATTYRNLDARVVTKNSSANRGQFPLRLARQRTRCSHRASAAGNPAAKRPSPRARYQTLEITRDLRALESCHAGGTAFVTTAVRDGHANRSDALQDAAVPGGGAAPALRSARAAIHVVSNGGRIHRSLRRSAYCGRLQAAAAAADRATFAVRASAVLRGEVHLLRMHDDHHAEARGRRTLPGISRTRDRDARVAAAGPPDRRPASLGRRNADLPERSLKSSGSTGPSHGTSHRHRCRDCD